MDKSRISIADAVSIGIGGMIGAGIFSILGVVAKASGTAMWLSFVVGGIVVLFSTYSYAKLGARYPSAGGAVQFLVKSFGIGTISGGINIFMWIAYIISIALYAQGFSAYFMTFFTEHPTSVLTKIVSCSIVILFTLINMLGAASVGKSEFIIVFIKVSILVFFSVTGLFFIHPENLAFSHWSHINNIFFGAGILFIGYEGFGLITNAAGNMDNPQKSLPKALYSSVFIVMIIYVAVSITVTGTLTIDEINQSGDYALAAAAKPFLGSFGFKLIAIAALLSTASAINATLFGAANVSYLIARDGELPKILEDSSWRNATGGLFITSLLVMIFILFFDLSGIAMMGSGAFLLIYAAVNAGHLRILQQTGAKKSLVIIALILCLLLFTILEIYTFKHASLAVYMTIILLLGSFVAAKIYNSTRLIS
jgi:amino acid transporter